MAGIDNREPSALAKSCMAAAWGASVAFLGVYLLAEISAFMQGGLPFLGVPGDPPGLKAAWKNLLVVTLCMFLYGPLLLIIGAGLGIAAFWCIPSNWKNSTRSSLVANRRMIFLARWGFPLFTALFLVSMVLVLVCATLLDRH